ncbi:MAG: TonB-dependent receptor plug domain-containing protein, partial [Gemmatimonadales bacterium]
MLRTSLLAALMLLARALPAQVADSAGRDSAVVQLEEIEVTGSIAPTAGPAIGSGIPARVSTVTGEEIEAWEPRLLADALATQPGISLYDDLGSAYKLNLSTRGFNVGPVVGLPPGVSVFLDGVRQNEPDAAEVNFDLLPMEHVQRVELLSGSGSLLGPNSLGGAVNLVTRRGSGPFEAEIEASGGSFESFSGEASAGGVSRGGWDYY